MAEYVEVHPNLFSEPRTKRFARMLGIKPIEAVGYLIKLWSEVASQNPDGNVTNYRPIDFAVYTDWDGDIDLFAKALEECGVNGVPGFIVRNENGKVKMDAWAYPRASIRIRDLVPSRLPWFVWQKLRNEVFQRDSFTCQYCGTTEGPFECDHIHPISEGGTNDISNLATACQSCNRSKSNSTEGWHP